MKTVPLSFVLLALTLAAGGSQLALPAEEKRVTASRWEYRVLTKEQVLDLGKKDLTAGLNTLGDQGWELVAIDGGYIFKRPKDQIRKQTNDLKTQIALIGADVEFFKERVAWSERMFKRGYVSGQQLQAERARLQRAEIALDKAQRELKMVPTDPKESGEKVRKPGDD